MDKYAKGTVFNRKVQKIFFGSSPIVREKVFSEKDKDYSVINFYSSIEELMQYIDIDKKFLNRENRVEFVNLLENNLSVAK